MLDVSNLNLHYGHSQILYDVSLSADTGKVTCLMGTNGVGKTSLIRAIAGSHARSSGTVILDGAPLPASPSHAIAHKGVAIVPQGREIFPLLTVRENMETAFACLPKDEHFIPDHIYDLFPILKSFLDRRGGDLSGGQQQQLAIARALITKPKLLLLDEPTEGIQPNIIQQIGEVISLLRDQGEMAIVLVEQYFDFAYNLADRFTVLKRGSVTMADQKSNVSRDELLAAVSV